MLFRSNVVFESAPLRRPGVVYDTECIVASADRLRDDSDSENVENFFVRFPLSVHFSIDAVQVFGPAYHARIDFCLLQRLLNERNLFLEQGFAFTTLYRNELGDFFVFLRVEMVESMILDRKSTRLNSSHALPRMPSSA